MLSSLVLSVLGCSFEAGTVTSDATQPGDARAADAPIDTPADASIPINLVASANGGSLDSFTSEYCRPVNPPGDCMAGYWLHTNVHDGAHAMGLNPTSRAAGWCSGMKASETPEVFDFSFAGGRAAEVERLVVQNWGENAGYYTTHIIVYGQPPGDPAWNVLVDTALAPNETPQVLDLVELLGAPPVLAKIRFALTDGQNSSYWEIGELEAWGRLQ